MNTKPFVFLEERSDLSSLIQRSDDWWCLENCIRIGWILRSTFWRGTTMFNTWKDTIWGAIFIQELRVLLVLWMKVSVDRLRGLGYEGSHTLYSKAVQEFMKHHWMGFKQFSGMILFLNSLHFQSELLRKSSKWPYPANQLSGLNTASRIRLMLCCCCGRCSTNA